MKSRSLNADSKTVVFGQVLLWINFHLAKQNTSTPYRLDFFDSMKKRWISFEGNKREIAIIESLHSIIGPNVPWEMLKTVPCTFTELHNRRKSLTAYRQGIVHVLENVYGITVPQSWESDGHDFRKWLLSLKITETKK
jgi:hypothetical protein